MQSKTDERILNNSQHLFSHGGFFLPFHWPRAHHVTCKWLPRNNGLPMRSTVSQINYLPQPSANNWSGRQWQITIFCQPRPIIVNYYSFKIFPRFWLVKTTRIIHHKQLLLTKNSVIMNQWRQKCSPLHIIESLTEKTWGQGSVIQQREKWPRGVYKFERR